MAYIFGFMNFENSSWYYMILHSEIIGTAPGHWSVKLIQFSFIFEIHYSVASSVLSALVF